MSKIKLIQSVNELKTCCYITKFKGIVFQLLLMMVIFEVGAQQSSVTEVKTARVERTEQLSLYSNGNDVYSFGIGTENDLLLQAFQVDNNLAFGIDRIADRIVLRRNGNTGQGNSGQERHILFFEKDDTFGGNNKNFRGGFFPTMEEALVCTCINRGADNVFANTGRTNLNNIQRLDYIFDDGIVVPNDPAEGGFPIFERGGNDPFKLAVIKDVDNNGDPIEFDTVRSYSSDDWENTGENIATAVLSGFPNDGGNLTQTADLSSQQVGVIFVSFEDLGFQAGEVIYGYSLAAGDATTNSTEFLDFENSDFYPTNTNETNGGIDLLSGGSFSRKAFIHTQDGWYQGEDPNEETTSCDDLLTITGGEASINDNKIFKEISAIEGSLNLNGNRVEICENLNTRFPFEIKSGVIEFNGSDLQRIRGDRNILSVDAIEINNSNGLEVQSPVEVFDYVQLIDGDMTLTNDFTFRCDFSGDNPKTAQIGILNGDIFGEVTTEQCYPGRRAFRFVSPSVTTTSSIRENWQENASAWNDNPNPGYGTHITGLGQQNPVEGTNDTTNGFDWQPSGNPSMFIWDNGSSQWSPIDNTDNTNLVAGQPIRLNIRGSRSVDVRFNTSATSNTILRETGIVKRGKVTFTQSDLGITGTLEENELILVGNPFQSIVNLNQVIESSSGVKPFVAIWDPQVGGEANTNSSSTELGGRGGYVVVNTINGEVSSNSTSNMNQFLQPKQALFFYADKPGESDTPVNIVFKEVHKNIHEHQTTVFSENSNFSLELQIFDELSYSLNSTSRDAFRVNFVPGGNNGIDQNDALKQSNVDENLARMHSQLLSIEERDLPQNEEELPLFINQYRVSDYIFKSIIQNLPQGVTPYLKDNHTDQLHELEEGEVSISFTVDANVNASTAFNRFSIVFDVTTMNVEDFVGNEISLYPNPVKSGYTNLALPNVVGESVEVSMFNNLGQCVLQLKETVNTNGEIRIDNINFPTGIYQLKANTASGKTFKYKLMVEGVIE